MVEAACRPQSVRRLFSWSHFFRWNDDPEPAAKEMLACLGRHSDGCSTYSAAEKSELSPEETAEYLWRRFVEPV